jgi:hypothetical protein
MANTKTSDETAASTLDGTELVRIVQTGNSRKVTATKLGVLGKSFRGVVARLTSDDTTVNATAQTTLSFDSAPIDTDSFWSAGAPTKLTIPSGLGIAYVSLVGQINVSASTADTWCGLLLEQYNSSDVAQRAFANLNVEFGAATNRIQVVTGPVAVTAGDYFLLKFQTESDTSITIEGDSTIWSSLALHVIGMVPV